ncbi:MAG: YibE/F family protein [Desulfamplus sp.]|nr:YibE/F family protein [Desulfamplus sp.]
MIFNGVNIKKSDILLVLFFIVLLLGILFMPTGFEKEGSRAGGVRCKARVVSVDNTNVQQLGIIKTGDQSLGIEIVSGPFQGNRYAASNPLMGHMEKDKLFREGDTAFVVLTLNEDGKVIFVNPMDHYRIDTEFLLMALFALLLLLFGGWVGFKALISFLFTGAVLWKILVPCLLKGFDPVIITMLVTTGLCAAITLLVAGFTKKGFTALAGACLGVATSGIMAIYFTEKLHIHGAVMPLAETLLCYRDHDHHTSPSLLRRIHNPFNGFHGPECSIE